MIANNTNKTDYNYVWRCSKAQAEDGKSIPMREGDYLFICVDAAGKSHFRYRKADWRERPGLCEVTRDNANLWANARADFDSKSGLLTGVLEGERKFEMTIKPAKQGFTIHCRHFVNPGEGEWDGDDDWGSGQQ